MDYTDITTVPDAELERIVGVQPDLSQVSDADLEHFANQAPAAPDLSQVSTRDLAAAAGINPLDDFDTYNAIENEKEQAGYDPTDPGVAAKIWEGVKGVAEGLYHGAKGLAKIGVATYNPASAPEASALLTQAGGEVLSNYKMLAEGAKTLTAKGVFRGEDARNTPVGKQVALMAALGPLAPAAQFLSAPQSEEMKTLSRKASWDFLREARTVDDFTQNFNQHLETIFPQALKGLGSIPVDREDARGVATVLDPANYVPAGAAARWTTQAPLRGAVRAAQAAVKEASLDVARSMATRDAANLLLKDGMNAAERAPIFNKAAQAGKELAEAGTRQQQAVKALTNTTSSQRAIVDQLANEAASQPLVTRALGGAAQAAGKTVESGGNILQKAGELPGMLAKKLAPDSEVAQDAIAQATGPAGAALAGAAIGGPVGAAVAGTARLTAPATVQMVQKTGRNLSVFGQLLSEAEGQLPFFKKLARETNGLTSFAASLVDQSGLGQFITPVAKATVDATRGAPIAGLIGYVGSGGDPDAALKSASGGMVFGLAGGAYGQWQRYLNGSTFRSKQLADVNRYRQTLPTGDAQLHFDQMPQADRAGLATMQLAHPDLKIKHERLGAGRPSFYYAAEDGPVAVINLDTKDGVNAVVAHEIGHHVEKHGLGTVIERVLFGDALLKQPGMYTELDAAGAPVIGDYGKYKLNPEWQAVKDSYNARIKATAQRAGEAIPARDDSAIAREVFAEHVADYLTGGNSAVTRDLTANIWTKALDGLANSELVAGMPAMRQVLGKLGVPLDTQKRVYGSNLFPGGLPASKQLRGLITNYERMSVRDRAPAIVDEMGGTRYTQAELEKHPQILDTLFNGSDDVARDKLGKAIRNADGTPKFTTPKEQAAQRAELAKDISTWMEQNAPRVGKDPAAVRPSGARFEQILNEKTGKVKEEGWVTTSIPTPLINQLKASGKYNPTQLAHLQAVSDAIAAGKGKSALFFYQPAKGPGGRYKSLAGDWRTETPYAIFVSKAGNVLFRSMSREKLTSNAQNLIKSGRAGLWNNEIGPLMTDVDTYLGNHAAGLPGETGLGLEKKNQLNALFGMFSEKQRNANPLLMDRDAKNVVVRSRRLDRVNLLSPVEEYFPTTYDRLNQNLRPEQ